MYVKHVIFSLSILFSNSLFAMNCETFANTLQSSSNTISTMGEFSMNANNFCSEYSKTHGSSKSQGANLGYAALSVGYSGSDASQEATYQRSCSGSSYIGNKNSDLQSYMKFFDPAAYSVFKSCLDLQSQQITFDFSDKSITPTELIVIVHSTIQMNAIPKLAWKTTKDVTCEATSEFKPKNDTVEFKHTAILHCSRNSFKNESLIALTILNGNSTTFPIHWDKYNNEGIPQNTLVKFQSSINNLKNQLDNLSQNSIVAFNSQTCPQGWKEVIDARGRFLRGIDTSGSTIIDPDGKREPGSIQLDTLKRHYHEYFTTWDAGGTSNNGTGWDHNKKNSQIKVNTNEGNLSDGTSLGIETRPKNIAVLFCSKS